jgi:hypothetical protein
MGRATIFYYTQSSGGYLIDHPEIKQYDTVGNIFFQSLARQRFFPTFPGNHGGDALFFKPEK